MTACFPADTEIAARPAPFHAMRGNATPARARLCQQMRKFVAKRLLDFTCAVIAQPRVQRDQLYAASRPGPPRCASVRSIQLEFFQQVVARLTSATFAGLFLR